MIVRARACVRVGEGWREWERARGRESVCEEERERERENKKARKRDLPSSSTGDGKREFLMLRIRQYLEYSECV